MNCPYCYCLFQLHDNNQCINCSVTIFEFFLIIELINKNKTFAVIFHQKNEYVSFYGKSIDGTNWNITTSIKMSYDTFIEQITPTTIDAWSEKINKMKVFL